MLARLVNFRAKSRLHSCSKDSSILFGKTEIFSVCFLSLYLDFRYLNLNMNIRSPHSASWNCNCATFVCIISIGSARNAFHEFPLGYFKGCTDCITFGYIFSPNYLGRDFETNLPTVFCALRFFCVIWKKWKNVPYVASGRVNALKVRFFINLKTFRNSI